MQKLITRFRGFENLDREKVFGLAKALLIDLAFVHGPKALESI